MRRLLVASGLLVLTGTLLAQAPTPAQFPKAPPPPHLTPTIYGRGFGLAWVEETRDSSGRKVFKSFSITSDKMIVTGDAVSLGSGVFEFTGKTTVTIRD